MPGRGRKKIARLKGVFSFLRAGRMLALLFEGRDMGIEDADQNAIFLFVDQLAQLVNKEKEEIKYGMFQSIHV